MPYSRGLKSSSFSACTREQSCSQHAGTCTGIKATIAQNAAFCQKKACWEPRWEAETWICRSEKLETYFQQPEMNRFPWKMTSFTTPAKLKWELFVSPLYFPLYLLPLFDDAARYKLHHRALNRKMKTSPTHTNPQQGRVGCPTVADSRPQDSH